MSSQPFQFGTASSSGLPTTKISSPEFVPLSSPSQQLSQQTPMSEFSPSTNVSNQSNTPTSQRTPTSTVNLKRQSISPAGEKSTPKSRKQSHAGPTQTPTSKNSRTGWALLLVKIESKIKIKMMVQRSNGKKGPFSSAGPNSVLHFPPLRSSNNSSDELV